MSESELKPTPGLADQPVTITGACAPPPGPDWIHQAVFYQVYPQTFYDSNGDGIGDLQGIIAKLDYIQSLGVDGIWINPFFESPFYDAGYDISDYYKVAARYGSNKDAQQLFEEAHRRGLKVIFDFVASYTSIAHPWFQASCRQEKNQYSNWYIWTNSAWESIPDFMKGSFIQGYARRNGQFMRNFFWNQPALNYGFADPDPERPWQLPVGHPDTLAMREEMKRVARFWMDLGADGFRADMAGALVKQRKPPQAKGGLSGQAQGTMAFWREIREIFDRDYPEAFMVSEWSYPKNAIAAGFHADFYHWFDGYNDLFQKESWRILNSRSQGHSFFDQAGKGNICRFLTNYLEHLQAVKDRGYISIPIGNHDLARLNTGRTVDELEIIFAFILTMPGIPFIYYGNEIGMRQLYDLPHVEGAYPPRAGARSPMQWSKDMNAGFSSAPAEKLYLPVDERAGAGEDFPNVAAQEQDPNSLLNRVRKLIRLKKQEKALAAYGEFVPLFAREKCYPFVYARAAGDEVILVALNPARETKEASFTVNIDITGKKLLAGKELAIHWDNNRLNLTVPGRSYAVYKCRRAINQVKLG
ncbi:MAG: glycosylase [Firmicutes bacterium]|nr:glycosylase [Bacillota bacterium]